VLGLLSVKLTGLISPAPTDEPVTDPDHAAARG